VKEERKEERGGRSKRRRRSDRMTGEGRKGERKGGREEDLKFISPWKNLQEMKRPFTIDSTCENQH
jgi:hypothetical protein